MESLMQDTDDTAETLLVLGVGSLREMQWWGATAFWMIEKTCVSAF